ncbi:hypothetical protein KCV87_04110 [Actinosynnema pretiosum subsp. pretiosum]|uniref:Uncharacterized protein n=1 Tax=Actinosynnema pretiosum subsp. pretiosum TaxID=103721 RepID=A0AA45R550_9PSEU|nr:Methionine ABC transporter ATP-binding protein [Actinosynnema pretiosum subsp. pretiosum]QUF05298.1 hypothetical protein KCV87_04110 [Actinosynnema pretiosum subsp. pretiosum]
MPTTRTGVRVHSVVPGRQRWQVPHVRANPRAAFALETALLRRSGITHVRANPVTGRVLVLHRRSLGVTEIGAALRDAVTATSGVYAPTEGARHPFVRLGVASGVSSVLLRGVLGRAALGVPLLLVVGGVVVLAAEARRRPPGRDDVPAQLTGQRRERAQRSRPQRPRPRRGRPGDVDGSRSFSAGAAGAAGMTGAALRPEPSDPPTRHRLDRDPAPSPHTLVPTQARPLHRRVPRHR